MSHLNWWTFIFPNVDSNCSSHLLLIPSVSCILNLSTCYISYDESRGTRGRLFLSSMLCKYIFTINSCILLGCFQSPVMICGSSSRFRSFFLTFCELFKVELYESWKRIRKENHEHFFQLNDNHLGILYHHEKVGCFQVLLFLSDFDIYFFICFFFWGQKKWISTLTNIGMG